MAGNNNTLEIASGGGVLGTNRFRLGIGATSVGNKLIVNNGTLVGTGIEAIRGDVTITSSSVSLSDYFSATDNAFVNGTFAATGIGTSTIAFNSGSVSAVALQYHQWSSADSRRWWCLHRHLRNEENRD